VAGEIPSPPIDPNAPVISNYDFARGFLFFIQGLASVALVVCLSVHSYAALALGSHSFQVAFVPFDIGVYAVLIEIGVYGALMAGTFLLHRVVRRQFSVPTDLSETVG
jgi:hypothetical protein